MNEELPKGWIHVTVGEIAEDISYGFTAKASTSPVGPRFLRITDIQNGSVNWEVVPYCAIPRGKINNYLLRSGDIVFARTGATTGKSFLVTSCPEAVFASYLIRVRPASSILADFLAFFFLSANYWTQISDNISGSAQPNCNATKLALLELPLPPLNEQRRIVAKLENILGKVDACQKRLERIPVILKRFRQSVLAAACSGRLTEDWRESSKSQINGEDLLENIYKERIGLCKTTEERRHIEHCVANARCNKSMFANGWIKLNAELLCDFITKGTTPRSKDEKPEIPFLKVYNIVDNKINFEHKPQFVSRKTHETSLKRSVVYPGDVLMNIVGPPLCKVAIVPPTFPEWNVNQAIGIFRPVSSLRSQFLYIALLGSEDLRRIISETRGIVGQSNISLQQCRDLEISIPACAEQDEIVRRVENLFKFADQIEVQYQKAKAHVDKLNQSVLAKAFRGELVPQDPDDEPADVLLERIRRGKGKVDTAAN